MIHGEVGSALLCDVAPGVVDHCTSQRRTNARRAREIFR